MTRASDSYVNEFEAGRDDRVRLCSYFRVLEPVLI